MEKIAYFADGVDVCGVMPTRTRALGWFMPSVAVTSPNAVKHQSPGSRLSPDST